MVPTRVARLAALAFGLGALAACAGAPALEDRPADPGAARFDGLLLALADADMAGTAYADGVLKPQAGVSDSLTVFADEAPRGAAAASNSVMGWPGTLALSADGRFAYVAETRGPAPAGAARVADVDEAMARGARLTALDLSDPASPREVGRIEVGRDPASLDLSPDGRFALVALKEGADAVAAVALENGVPQRVVRLGLAVPELTRRARDAGALNIRLAPDGRTFAVNVANTHVLFARLAFGPDGLPAGAEPIGPPLPLDGWLTVLRWAPDGRHLIVADVGWGPSQLGAALNGPGALIAVAFDPDGRHREVSRARVSLSPEAFEADASGTLFAVVNMERSYLPDRLPFALFGRRDASSLSLVRLDPASGRLETVDGPVRFRGVLPEDAVFDADGDMLAVAVFHGHEAAPQAGFVELFRVDRTGPTPRLIPTGRRLATPRGAHDLATAPLVR